MQQDAQMCGQPKGPRLSSPCCRAGDAAPQTDTGLYPHAEVRAHRRANSPHSLHSPEALYIQPLDLNPTRLVKTCFPSGDGRCALMGPHLLTMTTCARAAMAPNTIARAEPPAPRTTTVRPAKGLLLLLLLLPLDASAPNGLLVDACTQLGIETKA